MTIKEFEEVWEKAYQAGYDAAMARKEPNFTIVKEVPVYPPTQQKLPYNPWYTTDHVTVS